MGRFDDLRYIEQVKKEFTVKPKASKQNIEALKKSMNKENYSIQFSKASKHYDLTQDQINELEMYKDLISE